ncbi:MAG: hypothetical protein AAF547_09010 [Actinomycetota bacterium]
MGLLQRLSGDNAEKTALDERRADRLDPFLYDAELRNAYRFLVDGDWRRLERFLEESHLAWMFGDIILSDLVDLETVTFERWVDFKQTPRSRTYYASVQIRDAFRERAAIAAASTDGTIPRHEHQRFINRLNAAEEILYEVVTDRPALADPWVQLLVSGRGLQVHLEELRERFENAHSRGPFRPDATRQYLMSLTKKWGGSNTATFDFARWIEEESDDASPAREALPIAHIERGVLEHGLTDLATYLMQPDVVAELANGLLRFLQATPNPAPTEALGVLNAYALAITPEGESTARLAIETFARIDNRPTLYPWTAYSDDVSEVFTAIQAEQLRFANRF